MSGIKLVRLSENRQNCASPKGWRMAILFHGKIRHGNNQDGFLINFIFRSFSRETISLLLVPIYI